MTKVHCDICGKAELILFPLNPPYKTKDIELLCPDCYKLVDEHLWKVKQLSNKMTEVFIIEFMSNLKQLTVPSKSIN